MNRIVYFINIQKGKRGVGIQKTEMSKNLKKVVQRIYKETSLRVKTENWITANFKTSKRLLQRCSNSLTLFKIFLEHTLKPRKKFEGLGILI